MKQLQMIIFFATFVVKCINSLADVDKANL